MNIVGNHAAVEETYPHLSISASQCVHISAHPHLSMSAYQLIVFGMVFLQLFHIEITVTMAKLVPASL